MNIIKSLLAPPILKVVYQYAPGGEGGVGFFVRECLVDEVEFITDVHYEESVWMKVRGGRGSSAFYKAWVCVYAY